MHVESYFLGGGGGGGGNSSQCHLLKFESSMLNRFLTLLEARIACNKRKSRAGFGVNCLQSIQSIHTPKFP